MAKLTYLFWWCILILLAFTIGGRLNLEFAGYLIIGATQFGLIFFGVNIINDNINSVGNGNQVIGPNGDN
jgi:hypothetical protein